ncbi:hypothetical protein WA026_023698 [Henosepilachna vigintioctopunctata]|uniref:RNA helicase n=1 Tax=Henosepilachna vigintioctopunctata TaxID=420089 RepID=A0AAW1UTN9_9CUCU
METGSKYDFIEHIGNGNCIKNKFNTSQFQLKSKPSHITFSLKANEPLTKKMKLSENEAKSQSVTTSSYQNISENGNGTKFNGIKSFKLSLQEQRRQLPIFENKNKLLNLIKAHETLIIVGETGCGKTTQIPQYIHSARLEESGCIAITQPRRVAAISLAQRVAQEYGGGKAVGEIVGYTVRFEDVSSEKTKIKYLTDGMLLRESIFDEMLLNYTVVILDEAHERTVHTDILFGIIKSAQKKRREKNLSALKYDTLHVFEHINVVRCFKCGGFDHIAKKCDEKQICLKCGSVNHTSTNCNIDAAKCNNCLSYNKKFGLRLQVNHHTFDRNCEILMRKIENKKRYIMRETG